MTCALVGRLIASDDVCDDRSRELIATLNTRLPAWREQHPRRLAAVQWPTRTVVVDGGHEFEFPLLPWVGTTWALRGFAYWRKRVTAVVLTGVAVVVVTTLDVGFAEAAASSSTTALVGTVIAIVALAAAALLFYWRVDLFARDPVARTRRLPTALRLLGSVVGVAGLCTTPAWTLSFLLDMLPRFTVFERRAWLMVADQQPDGWGELAEPVRQQA